MSLFDDLMGMKKARAADPQGSVTQRWEQGADRYRPASEGFDPDRYEVRPIDETREARPFVLQHHYSRSFPSIRLPLGLIELGLRRRPDRLVGVLTFGHPSAEAAPMKWANIQRTRDAGELNRLVMLDEVPGNAETWFLGQAMPLAQSYWASMGDNLKLIISYSDPVVRRAPDGEVLMPGHIGNIYQAHNATFAGRASRRSGDLFSPAGVLIDKKLITKLRSADRPNPTMGWQYAERAVLAAGAPERKRGESYANWINRIKRSPGFYTRNHPGNLTYLWAIGDKRQRKEVSAHFPMTDLDAWLSSLAVENLSQYTNQMATPAKFGKAAAGLLPAYAHSASHWLKLLSQAPVAVSRDDAPLRGVQDWLTSLERRGGRVSLEQIQDWVSTHDAYPKRPRQRYISLLRKYERAWSRGDIAPATELAGILGETWRSLSSQDRVDLDPPPGSTDCRLPAGSSNHRRAPGSMSLSDLLSRTICRPGSLNKRPVVD